MLPLKPSLTPPLTPPIIPLLNPPLQVQRVKASEYSQTGTSSCGPSKKNEVICRLKECLTMAEAWLNASKGPVVLALGHVS